MKNSDIDRITGDLNRVRGTTVSAETWTDLSAAITATDPTATARPALVTSTNPMAGNPKTGNPKAENAGVGNAGVGRPAVEVPRAGVLGAEVPGARVPVAEVPSGRVAAFATGSDRRRTGRPRRLMLVAAMLAITVAVVGATALPSRHDQPRALSFTESGDKIIVRIVDPNADAKRYTKDFRAMGLNIKVRMVPVSPTQVGKFAGVMVSSEGGSRYVRVLDPGEKCNGTLNADDPGCQEGVEVDKRFKGWGEIEFGRRAKPGEIYHAAPGDATVPGEELAGLKVVNRRVSEVRPLIAARGVEIGSYLLSGTSPQVDSRSSVPGDWYVHGVSSHGPGVVVVWVGPSPEK